MRVCARTTKRRRSAVVLHEHTLRATVHCVVADVKGTLQVDVVGEREAGELLIGPGAGDGVGEQRVGQEQCRQLQTHWENVKWYTDLE